MQNNIDEQIRLFNLWYALTFLSEYFDEYLMPKKDKENT
jgi:hypothetical protein